MLHVAKIQLAQPLCEPVGEASTDLLQNVPLVIVAKCPRDLVVGHLGTIPVFSPQGGKSLGVVEAKQPFFSFLPRHHVLVLRLLEDAEGELPQLSTRWDI